MRVVIAEDSVLLAGRPRQAAGAPPASTSSRPSATPTELLAAVPEYKPDLVIADVRMPPSAHRRGDQGGPGDPAPVAGAWPCSCCPSTSRSGTPPICWPPTPAASGYLLKDRVADVGDFVAALRRVADGGTALDPEVVAQLLVRRRSDPLDRLTPREQEVLRLMAEGRSNAAIAQTLVITDSAVAKHINSIFTKLDLHPGDERSPPGAGRAARSWTSGDRASGRPRAAAAALDLGHWWRC